MATQNQNPGNFANDREKASEAGHKGGQNSGGNFKNDPERAAGRAQGRSGFGGNFKNDPSARQKPATRAVKPRAAISRTTPNARPRPVARAARPPAGIAERSAMAKTKKASGPHGLGAFCLRSRAQSVRKRPRRLSPATTKKVMTQSELARSKKKLSSMAFRSRNRSDIRKKSASRVLSRPGPTWR